MEEAWRSCALFVACVCPLVQGICIVGATTLDSPMRAHGRSPAWTPRERARESPSGARPLGGGPVPAKDGRRRSGRCIDPGWPCHRAAPPPRAGVLLVAVALLGGVADAAYTCSVHADCNYRGCAQQRGRRAPLFARARVVYSVGLHGPRVIQYSSSFRLSPQCRRVHALRSERVQALCHQHNRRELEVELHHDRPLFACNH